MGDIRRNIIVGCASAAIIATAAVGLFIPSEAAKPEETTIIYALGKRRSADEVASINALAQMLYGEARGVESTTEKAACVWVVLNRADDPRWSDDIIEVLSQRYQFGGYNAKNPVEDWARELAADVYDRWIAEKDGDMNCGRVIPSDYFVWCGERAGKHNWFYKEFGKQVYYTWDMETPYYD